jgi:hypothetical protein
MARQWLWLAISLECLENQELVWDLLHFKCSQVSTDCEIGTSIQGGFRADVWL